MSEGNTIFAAKCWNTSEAASAYIMLVVWWLYFRKSGSAGHCFFSLLNKEKNLGRSALWTQVRFFLI